MRRFESTSRPVTQGTGEGEALVAALLAGEPHAAMRSWVYLSPVVSRFLRRYFGSTADHEDLCQEVFLRFFTRIGELRVPHALRGFVISICLGVAQNERRRANLRRTNALPAADELPDHRDPVAVFEARALLGRLSRVLDTTDDQERALVAALYLDQLGVSEIATTMGRTFGTTKRDVARARRRISARIDGDPALADYKAALSSEREARV